MVIRPPQPITLRADDIRRDPEAIARELQRFSNEVNRAFKGLESEGDAEVSAGINTPEVIATTAAGQVVTDSASTIINFDTVEIDTDGIVTVGAAWKVTFTEPGTIVVKASVAVDYAGVLNFDSFLIICKSGAEYRRGARASAAVPGVGASYVEGVSVCADVRVGAGDYLDIRCYQKSGGNKLLEAYGPSNFVSMRRVR